MIKDINLKGVLLKPEIVGNIPVSSRWLAGEGAGSWFHFKEEIDGYCITRFSPEGKIECSSIFKLIGSVLFDIKADFEMQYLSHCSEVNIRQNNKALKFVINKDSKQ